MRESVAIPRFLHNVSNAIIFELQGILGANAFITEEFAEAIADAKNANFDFANASPSQFFNIRKVKSNVSPVLDIIVKVIVCVL